MAVEDSKDELRRATQLATYEGALIWSAFTAMLRVHTLLLAAVGLVRQFLGGPLVIARVLLFIGILLCVAWGLVLARQFSYYRFWWGCMRHFEREAMGAGGSIAVWGRQYERAQPTPVCDDGDVRLVMSPAGRLARVKYMMFAAIFSVGLLYTFVLLAL